MNTTVKFDGVTKKFKKYHKSSERFKDLVTWKETGDYHYALRDVSFSVQKGEIVGVIGLNGAGKSTLSNLISGVTIPTQGKVQINGQASLIAISSGLNGQLTGLENIELKGLMLGLTKEQIKDIVPYVIEFAEIGDFIDQPVKTYSSGMKARLGFAISINIDPDILVIDEALSVGDSTFTNKCLKKINEFKDSGKTIFFISHSASQIKKFCDKALWLHYGTVREYGEVNEVVGNYVKFLKTYNALSTSERKEYKKEELDKIEKSATAENKPRMRRKQKERKKRDIKQLVGIGFLLSALVLNAFLTISHPSIDKVKAMVMENSLFKSKESTDVVKEKKKPKPSENTKKPAEPELKVAVINKDFINIRNKASLDSTIVGQGIFGDVYPIKQSIEDTDEDMTWLQLDIPGESESWVSSSVAETIDSKDIPTLEDLSTFETYLTERNLPVGHSEVSSLFNDSFDRSKIVNVIQNEAELNNATVITTSDAMLIVKSDQLTELLLTNVYTSAEPFIPLFSSTKITKDVEDLYFAKTDTLMIKMNVDSRDNSVTSFSFSKRKNK
ncbi:teichoic acids export ABC transporter ATP-binding subunit TagH [Fictibacillus sp. b24]|uniref:teichoic acids export ABC transporter ATP-binding subunit TagH n=1 Tax=Fictibacillus sp. b24 TaxID=3055863 RepID=UPI0025A24CC7|nr:teichoic acids export ABC transporter ATP-binding subunit TagH [Fictibacillus sp. b24]MDM5314881.1 teichoic acids export ABC transporter ATP-binding subunit TagH [Fictibacillus sp. b24]